VGDYWPFQVLNTDVNMSSKESYIRKIREHFYGHQNITLLCRASCAGKFGSQFEDLFVAVFLPLVEEPWPT
jgi:hypothetical protein